MTKVCKNCHEEKSKDQFPFHNKQKQTLRAECIICYSIKRKDWHKNNKDIRNKQSRDSYYRHKDNRLKNVKDYSLQNKDKVVEWAKKSRKKIHKEFYDWKCTLKCSRCSENHPACLEFHHLDPSQKDGLITKLRGCRKKLTEELKKCIVLCSNCHRKEHFIEKQQNHVYNQENTIIHFTKKEDPNQG